MTPSRSGPERTEPGIALGPILYFRGEQGDRWRLSALFVVDGEAEPDDLRVEGVTLPVPPRHLTQWRRRHVWRFDFAIPRGRQDTEIAYGFPVGPNWSVIVPGRQSPTRLAYVFGDGMDEAAPGPVQESPVTGPGGLWPDLLDRHGVDRYHLLLHGGGQIDAGGLWQRCGQLAQWRSEPARVRNGAALLPGMAEDAIGHFFDLYLRYWSQAAVAEVLARIPSVMMWDALDQAPLPPGDLQSKVGRGIAMTARRHFALFQIGALVEALPDAVWGAARATFTQGFLVGEAGILALDLRAEPGSGQLLTERSWSLLPDWLARFEDCRHLLLMADLPLLFPDTRPLDWLTGILPGGRTSAAAREERWRSRRHAAEWQRMTGMLADFSRRTGCRVTILSGGMGFGGRALVRGSGVEIWQLLAPNLTRKPPDGWFAWAVERIAARREQLLPGLRLEMPPFPESGRRVLAGRGWLSLAFDTKGQLHARWSMEGDPVRHTQAI